MRDFSIVLPSWAVREGYTLEGGSGTFDDLYLVKDGRDVKRWGYLDFVPNIFEMESLINGIESQKGRLG